MPKISVSYLGQEAPRIQTCAFCGFEYDAIYGMTRPHGVCADCWPSIAEIEREHSLREPVVRSDFVLEWSHSQQYFHIELLEEALQRNLNAYAENRSNDYVILFSGRTHSEAQLLAEKLRGMRQER